MNDLIAGLLRLLLQLALLIAGLVVAASIVVAFAVLAVVFGLRLLWGRITGRPVTAFGLGLDPSGSWRRYRAWQQTTTRRAPRGAADDSPTGARTPNASQDVEDVQIKELRPPQ